MANKSPRTEEVEELIKGGENEFVEFKLEDEFQTDLAIVLMSMANSGRTCHLIIGVEDKPIKVRGVRNVKGVIDKLINAARQVVPSLVPYLEISTPEVGKETLVIGTIGSNLSGVYHVAGKYLKRHGTQKIPINAEELLRLLHQRGGENYEDQPVPRATLEDIDLEQVEHYLERREQRRTSRIPRTIDRVELLRKLGLLTIEGTPNVAGILFFGRHPQDFFPAQVIKAARFKDTSTRSFLDQQIITGTVPDMIDATFDFIQRNTRHGAHIEGMQRIEEDEYPAEAVRELLANACVHRDLSIGDASIRCQIFSDRLEIDSPGGLLAGLTVEKLLTTSKLRNRKLAELLYHIGYIEAQGTGIRRVLEVVEEAGLSSPKFDDQGYSLFVTLPGPEYGKKGKEIEKVKERVSSGGETTSLAALPFSVEELKGLNPRQRRFLVMLSNVEMMTREEYGHTFAISDRTAKTDLKFLQERRLVQMHGGGNSYYYTLAERSS